jgi:rhodanese-related sulfurtransferase
MNKQTIASALFGLYVAATQAAVINIDNAELTRLAASGVAVVDIRTEPEWKATGVIAGSKLLTFVDEKGRIDSSGWLEKIKSVAKPEQPIILICRSGNRSVAATQFLSQQAGYKTVYNAQGGMNAWVKEGRSIIAPKIM